MLLVTTLSERISTTERISAERLYSFMNVRTPPSGIETKLLVMTTVVGRSAASAEKVEKNPLLLVQMTLKSANSNLPPRKYV